MSGICGIFHLDQAPVQDRALAAMVEVLRRRGPDGHGTWRDGPVGLGHTLLWTLHESAPGRLPFVCPRSGCAITGDVRLDDRDELLRLLGIQGPAEDVCDEQLVLDAYLAWGESCLERLLGDFAFVIWDPRRRELWGARDPMGVRPFYYHHAPRKLFAFASEPRSILVLPEVPYRLNEGRIADFLVSQLEGIDKTSTFFEEVYRLPPAHAFRVSESGLRIWRYWQLEPGPELRLPSDASYAEAFLEVFTEAVRCRLRGRGRVGSMLSGGMDSGSIVAVASRLLRESGAGPLPTFSAVSEDETECVESQAVRAALTMEGLDPTVVRPGQLGQFQPELDELTWNLAEPFDNHMTLPRVMYLAASRRGVGVVLDGIDGDTVLSEGHYLARLVRRGRWWKAYGEFRAQADFWGAAVCPSPFRDFIAAIRLAFVPNGLRLLRRRLSGYERHRLARNIERALICPRFADRINLRERLSRLDQHRPSVLPADPHREHARMLDHPYVTVAVERYGRVAAAIGLEPRHPFLDTRLMTLCTSLPGDQKLRGGWPKRVLRHAMQGALPETVRWRSGKEHLGSHFTQAYVQGLTGSSLTLDMRVPANILDQCVKMGCLGVSGKMSWAGGVRLMQQDFLDDLYDVLHLAVWLTASQEPTPERFAAKV